MIQQERAKKDPAQIESLAAPQIAPTERYGSSGWVIGALVVLMLAVVVLGSWTLYERAKKSDAEGLAQHAVAAWDSAKPGELAQVYDPSAVLVDASGTKIVGIDAIATAIADRGPDFAVTQVGGVTTTSDGSYATTSYRFGGDGQGIGISVIKVDGGKIIRQWAFEPNHTPSPAAK